MALDPVRPNPGLSPAAADGAASDPTRDPDAPIELEELEIVEPLCAVFRSKLRADGQKYTPERAHILDTIIRLDGLFEAETLLDRVKADGFRVSKATIYRTLKLLEDCGIVERITVDRDQSHYQLVYGTRPNALLINTESGQIETLDLPELNAIRDRICRERGLEPQGHRLQIFAVPAKN